MRKVSQTGAIVSSMFPAAIRDQLLEEQDTKPSKTKSPYMSNNHRVQHFLRNGDLSDHSHTQTKLEKPIATLFPNTTIMFCDVANFASWASTRDAGQVFQFLQAIFQECTLRGVIAHTMLQFRICVSSSHLILAYIS